MTSITSLAELDNKFLFLQQVEAIFFEASSLKEFSSLERKQAFYQRWCKDYQDFYPQEFLIMSQGQKVLGYLSGCKDSGAAVGKLEVPGYALFADMFDEFPAHLHINFHHDCRGMGLGGQLVNCYLNQLKHQGVRGAHLVTSPGAQNVSFYQKLGFEHKLQREFKDMPLLFMGTILDR